MSLWDLANADWVIVMGSNMAENHPIAFRFVVQAQRRGATLIHVDPRFTRTSAMSDVHAPIRSGTDIAFLGGMIRYILETDGWFRDYVMAYTNIAHIIDPGFVDADADGLFSGFDEEKRAYSDATWQYEGKVAPSATAEHRVPGEQEGPESLARGPAPTDPTLQHERCVYQIMKRHYARYTPEMVEGITGCPADVFLRICRTVVENSGRERTGSFCYAVGWTHHTTGVQIIRACTIVQTLLGNIGRPGGGIMALRGHVSIQGSTDIPTLYNMLPTYLPQPDAMQKHGDFAEYLETETPATGYWHNFPKYITSLLKAWYGDAATAANDYAFDMLPKLTGDVSQQPMTLAAALGVVKGQFVLGQNPAVGSVNTTVVERGLAKLEWLVVRDMAMTETAEFWRTGQIIRNGETSAEAIGTEVFLFPTALAGEKAGTVTNTTRLVQWHDAVLEPPGDSRSDLWFMVHLGRRLKRMYAGSTDERDRPMQALTWDYPLEGDKAEPDAEAVLAEINGYTVADRVPLASAEALKADGSTACGGWLYCGVMPGENKARSRVPDGPGGDGSHRGWAFAWPSNRRTLYNRASADPAGQPWSERKKMIWWDEAAERWTGLDTPDFPADKRPDYRPDYAADPHGMDAIGGADPFIMEATGQAQLFVTTALKDGPLPIHYEPSESPVHNQLYGRDRNPTAKFWPVAGNALHDEADPRFPYVLTTFRLTELHCGGVMSRVAPHMAELQPEAFCEIPPELAERLGIEHMAWTTLSTLRGEIAMRAMVTDRVRPFTIGGREVFQICVPWVFGARGYANGAAANVLLAMSGDANTSIHSTKALTCNLRPGRG